MATYTTNVVGSLMGIHAQTALHPGAGTALGTVDLPIQRERHTQWPTIAGSAVKGVLRDMCREAVKGHHQAQVDEAGQLVRTLRQVANAENKQLVATFGPDTDHADEHAGALSVTDARIIAFPVRSLKGVFAWVTCPAVLDRLRRDIALVGRDDWATLPSISSVGDGFCLTPTGCQCVIQEDDRREQIVLEEFDFERLLDHQSSVEEIASWIATALLRDSDDYQPTATRLAQHLIVLSDSDFTYFVRHATQIDARIALNYDTKTVAGTALFYQEFLPAETILYVVLLANSSRVRNSNGEFEAAASVLEFVADHVNTVPFLQIGGDESTGKGICGVYIKSKKEGTTP